MRTILLFPFPFPNTCPNGVSTKKMLSAPTNEGSTGALSQIHYKTRYMAAPTRAATATSMAPREAAFWVTWAGDEDEVFEALAFVEVAFTA